MLTRRGFIGSMLAVPAASIFIGSKLEAWPLPAPSPAVAEQTEVALLTDFGATRGVSAQRFARAVFTVVDRRLRGLGTRVVGSEEAHLGDVWGSGIFQHHIFALVEDLPTHQRDLRYDRLLIESIGNKLADKICTDGLFYFGRLPLPNGGVAHAVQMANSRFSLRFVTTYDIVCNRLVGRFDVLG